MVYAQNGHITWHMHTVLLDAPIHSKFFSHLQPHIILITHQASCSPGSDPGVSGTIPAC